MYLQLAQIGSGRGVATTTRAIIVVVVARDRAKPAQRPIGVHAVAVFCVCSAALTIFALRRVSVARAGLATVVTVRLTCRYAQSADTHRRSIGGRHLLHPHEWASASRRPLQRQTVPLA